MCLVRWMISDECTRLPQKASTKADTYSVEYLSGPFFCRTVSSHCSHPCTLGKTAKSNPVVGRQDLRIRDSRRCCIDSSWWRLLCVGVRIGSTWNTRMASRIPGMGYQPDKIPDARTAKPNRHDCEASISYTIWMRWIQCIVTKFVALLLANRSTWSVILNCTAIVCWRINSTLMISTQIGSAPEQTRTAHEQTHKLSISELGNHTRSEKCYASNFHADSRNQSRSNRSECEPNTKNAWPLISIFWVLPLVFMNNARVRCAWDPITIRRVCSV